MELQKQALGLSFPLQRKKTNDYLDQSGRLGSTDCSISALHVKVTLLRRPGVVQEGGDNWRSYARKLEHKSVPERLEKEAVVTAERVRPEEMQRRGPSCSLAWDN